MIWKKPIIRVPLFTMSNNTMVLLVLYTEAREQLKLLWRLKFHEFSLQQVLDVGGQVIFCPHQSFLFSQNQTLGGCFYKCLYRKHPLVLKDHKIAKVAIYNQDNERFSISKTCTIRDKHYTICLNLQCYYKQSMLARADIRYHTHKRAEDI